MHLLVTCMLMPKTIVYCISQYSLSLSVYLGYVNYQLNWTSLEITRDSVYHVTYLLGDVRWHHSNLGGNPNPVKTVDSVLYKMIESIPLAQAQDKYILYK